MLLINVIVETSSLLGHNLDLHTGERLLSGVDLILGAGWVWP